MCNRKKKKRFSTIWWKALEKWGFGQWIFFSWSCLGGYTVASVVGLLSYIYLLAHRKYPSFSAWLCLHILFLVSLIGLCFQGNLCFTLSCKLGFHCVQSRFPIWEAWLDRARSLQSASFKASYCSFFCVCFFILYLIKYEELIQEKGRHLVGY